MRNTIKKIELEDKISKQREAIEKGEVPEIKGTYEIIVIDPPWKYNDSGNTERGHLKYPTMNQQELKEIVLPASENCILWLWTTNSFMKDAFRAKKENRPLLVKKNNKGILVTVGRYKKRQNQFNTLPIAAYRKHGVFNLKKKRPFINNAAIESGKLLDKNFVKNATMQIKRYTM